MPAAVLSTQQGTVWARSVPLYDFQTVCYICLAYVLAPSTSRATAVKWNMLATITRAWKISWYPNVLGAGFGHFKAYVKAATTHQCHGSKAANGLQHQ